LTMSIALSRHSCRCYGINLSRARFFGLIAERRSYIAVHNKVKNLFALQYPDLNPPFTLLQSPLS